MVGVKTGRRGDGLGDENGEAVDGLVRERGPNPGAATAAAEEGRGEPTLEVGVPVL